MWSSNGASLWWGVARVGGNQAKPGWVRRVAGLCLVALVLFVGGSRALGAVGPDELVLRAGESSVLQLEGVVRVAVGQPNIADVKVVSPAEVLVNGKNEGQTTLLVWARNGVTLQRRIKVLRANGAFSSDDLLAIVADPGLKVKSVSGYFVMEGTVAAEGRRRVERLAALLGPQVIDLTFPGESGAAPPTIAPALDGRGSDRLHGLLTASVGSGVRLEVQEGRLYLLGTVSTPEARQTALRLAESFFAGRTVDAMEIVPAPAPAFTVKARVVEVDRQAARELGVEWPEAFPVGESASGAVSSVQPLVRLEPLLVKIKALEESGQARILAEPSLIVESSAEGAFLAGGQIPVPLEQDGHTTVEWKEYGVRLHVSPQLLPNGEVRVKVRPEVSTLDWANGTRVGASTVPALRSRWAETIVTQKSGETLILAGLTLGEETSHDGKIPFLGGLPLVGGAFKAGRSARHQTDLTILVTTELATSKAVADKGGTSRVEQPGQGQLTALPSDS